MWGRRVGGVVVRLRRGKETGGGVVWLGEEAVRNVGTFR